MQYYQKMHLSVTSKQKNTDVSWAISETAFSFFSWKQLNPISDRKGSQLIRGVNPHLPDPGSPTRIQKNQKVSRGFPHSPPENVDFFALHPPSRLLISVLTTCNLQFLFIGNLLW